ncbi:MAG: putative DsbA family dithiol-disulfide isomerase [Kiritimatiellia bacterium]|jgi:predicted DsbA family dithiol-disulfide isomerase
MNVDIWSDVACPWCAIGRQHMLTAIAEFTDKADTPDEVTIRWRSFQLNADEKPKIEGDYATALAQKYGMSRDRAKGLVKEMSARGTAIGVPYNFDIIQAGNTFDCHRLLHLALEAGLQDALKTRLFLAYFNEGQLMSDHAALLDLAVEVGLDADRVRQMLSSQEFAQDVRRDQQLAQQIGVRGVPFFVMNEKLGVSGAQPVQVLVKALEQVWGDERQAQPAPEAPACGPDSCEV